MDLRRAALITCVTGILSSLLPMWKALHRVAALEASYPRWIIPMEISMALTALFVAIVPIFYFALYRDEGTLRFSRSLRLLALVTAFGLGVETLVELPGWIASIGHEGVRTVLDLEHGTWTIGDVSVILGLLSNAAIILVMIVIYSQTIEESTGLVPASKFLKIATRVAVFTLGPWVAFHVCRLVVTPVTYRMLVDVAAQVGRTPPPLRDVVGEAVRMVVSQTGLLAGPFIIWRTMRSAPGNLAPDDRTLAISPGDE